MWWALWMAMTIFFGVGMFFIIGVIVGIILRHRLFQHRFFTLILGFAAMLISLVFLSLSAEHSPLFGIASCDRIS
jgi:hypothetical protein